jgi:outer membrane biosynthesis protein TonB
MTARTLKSGYSGKESSLHNMIFLSLIIHLIVITVILVSVPTTSRHLTFGPVYSVQLVSPADVSISANSESSLMKEIEKSNEAASSVIYKRQASGLAPTPLKNEEINKVNVEKAVSAIKQKQVETPAPTYSSRTISGNRSAKMTSSEIAAKTSEYAKIIESRVHNNWSLPRELWPRGDILTIVEVKIMRDGSLAYMGFEKRSINSFYDDTAMKAVKKSIPFPALPDWYPNNSLEIGIRFPSSKLH